MVKQEYLLLLSAKINIYVNTINYITLVDFYKNMYISLALSTINIKGMKYILLEQVMGQGDANG